MELLYHVTHVQFRNDAKFQNLMKLKLCVIVQAIQASQKM